MPRKSRIDAPHSLHHIIVRGIERGAIFLDQSDYRNFTDRIGSLVKETGTSCCAWAFIPNHFHLLLKTGRGVLDNRFRNAMRSKFTDKCTLSALEVE